MKTRAGLLAAGLVTLMACTGKGGGVVKQIEPTTTGAATSAAPTPSDAPSTTVGAVSTSTAPRTIGELLPPGVDGAAPIAPDDEVRIETLDNGLTVYIRANDNPGRRAELRLAVNAGSVLQDDDQSGGAHFLEHMLFNGTTKYPQNELINVLQGFGMEFGADVNAYTSHDETVYELSVPTDDAKNLPTAVDVLAEWLTAATLDEEQVIAERGVVLDEWRGDASFRGRVFDAIERLLFTGTAYEGRDPIGTDTAIEATTSDTLRRFYDRWYRPDNAAVVIVGDVDVDDTLALVRERLSSAAARGDSPARPTITMPPIATPGAQRHVDSDTVDAFVELTLARPASPDRTTGTAVEDVLQSMVFDVIAQRLSDDISRGLLPLTSASVDSNEHVRPIDAPTIIINSQAADSAAAMQALLDEFERVRRFGFNAGEVNRVVTAYRSSVESNHDSADSTQDSSFAADYVANFLDRAPIASADDNYGLAIKVLDWVTPAVLDGAFARRWTSTAPRLLIVGPESADADIPTEQAALDAIAAMPDRALDARPDETFDATSLMTAPEPVTETDSQPLPKGAFVEPTMLTFANGAKVVINANDIVTDGVAFAASSPGGFSLLDDSEIAAAILMPEVMMGSGIGALDAVQRQAVMADASVDFLPSLDQTSENMSGGAATSDLEALFQLVHLTFTGAKFDQAALDTSLSGWQPYVDDPNADPGVAAALALATARYGDSPRFRPVPTAAGLGTVTLDALGALWKERFAGANDWVFVFSGDLDVDAVTELARQYIGSIPGGNPAEQWVDLQPDAPAGIVVADVSSGTGEQAGVRQLYTASSDGSIREQVLADVLSTIASSRLTDHVREQLGASYSPGAFVAIAAEPDVLVETFVDVSGSPDDIERLSEVVRADLAELAADGPTEADLAEAVAELRQNYDLFNNGDLSELLLDAALDPAAVDEFMQRPETLARLTRSDVAAFAARALPSSQFIEVRMRPA